MSPRTLIIHTGGVGDFLCALPALAQLATDQTLEIAGIPERAALARAVGIAAAAHDLDRTDFHTVFSRPSARLRAFCAPFERALVWLRDEDGTIARQLQATGIPEVACYPGVPPADWSGHAAEWYARCAGVAVALPVTFAFPPAETLYDVLIHPGSGDPAKNWPLDRFEALAALLADAGHEVGWIYGPAEGALPRQRGCVAPASLETLAGMFTRARLFVGNDGGAGHLAAVAGCPCVSIFGRTNPDRWRPIGRHVAVVQGAPWPPVTAVADAALTLLKNRKPG